MLDSPTHQDAFSGVSVGGFGHYPYREEQNREGHSYVAKADNILIEFGLLQMVSEPGSGRCASEDAGPPRGVDCEVPHRLGSRCA